MRKNENIYFEIGQHVRVMSWYLQMYVYVYLPMLILKFLFWIQMFQSIYSKFTPFLHSKAINTKFEIVIDDHHSDLITGKYMKMRKLSDRNCDFIMLVCDNPSFLHVYQQHWFLATSEHPGQSPDTSMIHPPQTPPKKMEKVSGPQGLRW